MVCLDCKIAEVHKFVTMQQFRLSLSACAIILLNIAHLSYLPDKFLI